MSRDPLLHRMRTLQVNNNLLIQRAALGAPWNSTKKRSSETLLGAEESI